MTTRRLTIEILIDSRKAEEALRKLESDVEGFGGTVNRKGKGSVDGFEKSLLSLGKQAAIAAFGVVSVATAIGLARRAIDLAIGGIVQASLEFASFDQAIGNVGAISGATREELAALSNEALRLAKATRFSPEQTAGALYSLASAGQAAKEQIASLPAVLNFAEAAQADLGKATELIVSGIKGFGLAATDSTRVADVFTAAIGASAFNAERLQLAMRNAGPSAAAFGQSLEGTVAASSALVNVMLSGERAGTGLRAVFTELSDRGGKLGIAVRDAEGSFRPLVDIIRDMEASGWDASRAVRDFGAEAGPALAVLLDSGSGALQTLEGRLQSSGQAADVAREQLDRLQGDIDQFTSAQDEAWKVFGMQLEDGSRVLVQAMTAGLSEVTTLVRENGEEISRAWLVTVLTMIGTAEAFGMTIARLIDQFVALGDSIGGFSGILPPAIRNLGLLSVVLHEQVTSLSDAPGPAEQRFRAFFDSLREGATASAAALAELESAVPAVAAGVASSLREMGFDPETLRSLEDVNAELAELQQRSGVDLAAGIRDLGIELTNLRDLDQLERINAELERMARVTGPELVASLAALGIVVTNLGDLDQLKAVGVLLDKMLSDQAGRASIGSIGADEKLREKVAGLAAGIAQATRQEEFLLAALRRGEQEFRRAERVVAAYNAVVEDGKVRLDLFDEALKLEGLRTQRENLERLARNFEDLARNVDEADKAYRDFLDNGPTSIDQPERTPRPENERIGVMTEEELAAYIASLMVIDQAHVEILATQGKSLETLQDWQGAAYIVADAFADVDSALADVFASAGDFLGALTQINAEGGKLNAMIAGMDTLRAIGEAASGPNNYAAEGAAAGALIGALVGAYYGNAQAGAAIGSSAGGALGSFVKKGVDEFLGHIREAEGYAVSQMDSASNSISQVGKQFADAIARGINDAIDALGGELSGLPQLDIKIRDGVYSVFSNGIVARFKSMQEAVDFAILQALRDGDIYGLSEEVRQALQNSTAESFAAMARDLDFARWVEGLPEIGELASDSATALDAAVEQYRAALRKATQLGIDTAKIDQWFGTTLEALRKNILGIVETEDERIKRDAEAFNREVQLLEAEQLARAADLASQKANLEAEVAVLRAKMLVDEQNLNLRKEMLDVEIQFNTAEWELLQSKLEALAAIDAALLAAKGILANLPDLISDQDIQDAINRARGGGGKQRAEAREDLRAEVLLFGLSDVQKELAEAGRFADDFAERLKGMGFSAAEAAELLARAQEEEDRLVEEVRNNVRQDYYDVIAAAQGLAEIWDIKDKFRDLRQAVLDAGFSAEETAARMAGLAWAENVELQRVEMGIAGRLFDYLEGSEEYAARSLEFKQAEINLEFAVMQAQLQLLGVWDEYIQIWTDAKDAALALLNVNLTPPPALRNSFNDAARDAERIAESFMRAKQSVAEFLNEMLVGTFGGVNPVGGVDEARRQLDEVIRQAMGGNIGAIEGFDDYASTLLRLARDAYGSSPEFQAIYDYVLAAGRDILGVKTGREGNLIFDERFYTQNETAIRQRDAQTVLMERIAAALERQERGWRGTPIVGQGVNP